MSHLIVLLGHHIISHHLLSTIETVMHWIIIALYHLLVATMMVIVLVWMLKAIA